jgi:DNA repair protein RecO (recombination protein O)
MIVRTEAVVLRSLPYGETSRIVTLFTRDRGKLAVMAKGARRTKSRFGSTLQPMSYVQVVYYYKPSRSLQLLSDSSHVTAFHQIGRDLEKISIGLRIVELTSALMQDEQQNALVFNLLLQVLHRLDGAGDRLANTLPYFQMRLATALGFSPAFQRDIVQELPDSGGALDFETGAIFPPTATGCRRASRSALRAFAVCARADLDAVMRMNVAADTRIELNELVEEYLKYHVEEAYPFKSNRVISQLARRPH